MANKLVDESGLNQAMVEVNKTFIKNTDTLFNFGDTAVKKGGTVNLPSLYKLVTELPTASADTQGAIYLVASTDSETDNIYAEYITVNYKQGQAAQAVWHWEKLGEYQPTVDLTPYAKQADLNTLKNTVDGHTQKLAEHTSAISKLQGTVSGHTTTIGQHTTKLSQLDYTVLTTAAVTSLCNTIFGSQTA